LTFTWGVAAPGVQFKTSTVTIPPNGSVGGIGLVGSGAYGQFTLGAPSAAALTVDGGFTGGDMGAKSSAPVLTTPSVRSLGNIRPSLTGIKGVNIGIAQINLQ